MGTITVAARQPLFLAVLVVSLITGLVISPWLLSGLLVYAAAVFLASRDTTLLEQHEQREKRQGITSTTFLSKLNQIEQADAQVERAIAGASGALKQTLETSLGPQTDELVNQAYTLARKGQTIEAYLAQMNPAHLNRQIEDIASRIQKTSDEYTRDQLEGTHQALIGQRDSARVLDTYIGRITSQLDNIQANLSAMPAQILRMRASDVDAMTVSQQVASQLSDLNSDMQAFVHVLDSAIDQSTASAPY